VGISSLSLKEDTPLYDELLKLGYIVLSRISPSNSNSQQSSNPNSSKYLKTYNPYGETVFILLEECDYPSCVLNESSTVTETGIPVKLTYAQCNNLDICGVAFECDSNVCVLKRNSENPLMFNEANFVQSSVSHPASSSMQDGINFLRINNDSQAYPIVKLSDLRSNPEAVLKSADQSFKRMRNLSYNYISESYTTALNEVNIGANELSKEIFSFDKLSKSASISLIKDIGELEHMVQDYHVIENQSEDMKRKYKIVVANLFKRHQLMDLYIKYMTKFIKKHGELKLFVDEMKDTNKLLSEILSYDSKII
jgi:hypothetical protein